eukprot:8686103-Pyramimonas_sp.AAC.1
MVGKSKREMGEFTRPQPERGPVEGRRPLHASAPPRTKGRKNEPPELCDERLRKRKTSSARRALLGEGEPRLSVPIK